jgi:hypothetical protein
MPVSIAMRNSHRGKAVYAEDPSSAYSIVDIKSPGVKARSGSLSLDICSMRCFASNQPRLVVAQIM